MGLFIGDRSEWTNVPHSGATWSLSSKSDPRWNTSGEASGIFSASPAIEDAVTRLTALYGPPPDDLEYGAWKE